MEAYRAQAPLADLRQGYLAERLDLYAIAEVVGRRSHLFVQPHPWLARLPLEVLVEPGNAPGQPRYVADSLAISYLPSCATLVWLRSQPAGTTVRRLVALGDPDFGRGLGVAQQPILQTRGVDVVATGVRLPALPNTRREVAAAEEVFAQRKFAVSALLGPDATESRLRAALAAGASHLVIATHGMYEPGSLDSEPVLFLGQPHAGADGVLRSSEVYGLTMDLDVVVLSACQTGLGRGVPVEGSLGFPRAFLASGARNVVVSQWPVDDDATSR